MREVSQFVVAFPDRLIRAGEAERGLLLDALRREYPHYEFDEFPGRWWGDEDEFGIVPVMGRVGDGDTATNDRIYMCRPLDPAVIPDLIRTLQTYEALGATMQ